MTNKIKKIVFVGAGNLATQLAKALFDANYTIQAIYSHTINSAKNLGQQVNCTFCCNDTAKLPTNADLYIYALKDQFLEMVIQKMPPCSGIHVHTAGSLSLRVFTDNQTHTGIFYPFQTFSKSKPVCFQKIPIFIESSQNDVKEILLELAHSLSDSVYELSSEDRKILHLTGVFACNFTNYLWKISEDLLQSKQLPFQVVLPLIEETVTKLQTLRPVEAQTGPAIREDIDVMNQHLDLLQSHKDLQKIYQLLSQGIMSIKDKKDEF
ncbi:DUF2520 domain-containing protein [Gammaproteobacteria bacterium]|nr:DUF2520 domain-containing protein [Gammaproteobacteria bacterium]